MIPSSKFKVQSSRLWVLNPELETRNIEPGLPEAAA